MAELVTIGDSLTQGFSSLAISRTDQSYPALVARALGLGPQQFRQPRFSARGGLPFNLEHAVRALGNHVSPLEWPIAAAKVVRYLKSVEEYWERGAGSAPWPDEAFHNLAVWGFEAGDAYALNAGMCQMSLRDTKPDWFEAPSQPRLRTGFRVLNPAQLPARAVETQLSLAKRIAEQEGGIEHLLVWLGANNILGTVVALKMEPETTVAPGPRSGNLLWTPDAFEQEYAVVAERAAALGARKVFVATIPHVVIPPLTHGFMDNGQEFPNPGEKHYDRYIYVFADKERFDPKRDHHLTKADADKIDGSIDRYNEIIRKYAAQYGFYVVDICKMLEDLAYRRNRGRPPYSLPPALADLDTRFLRIDAQGRRLTGGLFGLDGIHPSACGYALIAQEFINVIRQSGSNIADVDFAQVRLEDDLVRNPPPALQDVFGVFALFEKHLHFTRYLDTRELVHKVV